MRRPPLLAAGARVALVAPSGPLRGEEDLQRAVDNVRSFGWQPVVAEHALERDGYFAGADELRLADLNRAIVDDSVAAIWCLRGGYGAMRLLDGVDFESLRAKPKALIGYSDITALHAAVGVRAGLVSYHGPTARATLTDFSRSSLERALSTDIDPCGSAVGAATLRAGVARGTLVGGNLALVASLCGTPYAPVLDGAILVLEDVNEAVYRIDRMLVQLRLSGMLARCAALLLGAFTNAPEEEGTGGSRALADVFHETAERLRVPVLAGIPIGHIDNQWTLPLGAVAEVDAGARTVHVLP